MLFQGEIMGCMGRDKTTKNPFNLFRGHKIYIDILLAPGILTVINGKKVSAYFPVKVKIKLKDKTIKTEKAPELNIFNLYPVIKINQDQVSHSPPIAA
jgi:hypothetical protein